MLHLYLKNVENFELKGKVRGKTNRKFSSTYIETANVVFSKTAVAIII
jgi:hypothetical protein